MKTAHLTIIATFCSFIGISFSGASAEELSMGGPVQTIHYQFSQMAASGNNVYVTYQENIGNGAGASVFFRKSWDAGSNFNSIIKLSNGTNAANPLVAASGNNVYVTWMENWGGRGISYVMFERSSDGGNTFSAPIRISDGDGDANPQQIITNGNNVYILIDYALHGNTMARFSFLASHDNGATFGNSTTLLEDTRGFAYISTSEDGNTVYAFGEDSRKCPIGTMKCNYDIFLKKSTDSGLSFGEPDIIRTTNEQIFYPQIASNDTSVYLVWEERISGDSKLFFVKSNNLGTTFSKPIVINQQTGESSFPHMATNGKNVFLVWDYSNESVISSERRHHDIMIGSPVSGFFFTKSSDGGNSFSDPINLSNAIGTSYWSNIAASGNNVFVSWGSKFGDKENVFIRKSIDSGTSFDDAVKLTDEKQDYFQKQMVSSGRNVYVAIDTAFPGDDLFLTASHDYGNTFGTLVNLNHEGLLHLGPPSKVPAVQVYPENSHADDLYNAILLAAVGVPIAIGVSIGMLLFTRKRK